MRLFSKIYVSNFMKFAIVGILNTLIGTFVMFLCYNFWGLGYWVSSAMNYIVGSFFSYFANKYFTFKSNSKSIKEIIKFILNISICYLVAYGCAKPLVRIIVGHFWQLNKGLIDEIAMLVGMFLFVIINYFGQKLFVFCNAPQ